MRKHYETTPKEILINILISARKEFNKLQSRNKEYKQEIERLNNIINKAIKYLESYNTDFKHSRFNEAPISIRELGDLLDILKGSDK